MPGRLHGRKALVTGASSGIGRATALAFATEGASIAIGARRADQLAALEVELRAAGAAQVLAVELDVTEEPACRAAVAATVAAFGGLDLLVNNAGVMLLGQIEAADTDDWRRMINTNVLGLMYMTHAALPQLLAHGGDLVQVSSTAGRMARAGSGVYNASKWAVNAFSEALRQEVTKRGVRVVVVEPGVTDTELREHITQPDAKQRSYAMAASVKQLQAGDVGAAILTVVTQPAHVAINEILIRPTDQEW